MEIKIVIDGRVLRKPSFLRGGRYIAAMIGVALLISVVGLAADISVFEAGQPISASQMNANFAAIMAGVADAKRPSVQVDGHRYSIGAVFIRTTKQYDGLQMDGSSFDAEGTTNGRWSYPDGSGGTAVGWTAAKLACETVLGSPTAHACTGEEMLRSAQVGRSCSHDAWYVSDTSFEAPGAAGGDDNVLLTQCRGWTAGEQHCGDAFWSCYGSRWAMDFKTPARSRCSDRLPVACCDHPPT